MPEIIRFCSIIIAMFYDPPASSSAIINGAEIYDWSESEIRPMIVN